MARSVPSCNPTPSSSGAPTTLTPCDQAFNLPLDQSALTRSTLPQLGGTLAPVVSGAIASGQIGCVHLADDAVCARAIADGAVGSGAVASGSIGLVHFASGLSFPVSLSSGQIVSGLIANAAVVSGSVASGVLGLVHFASGIAFPFSLASGQVQSGHVADGAVVSGSIASGQIGPRHIAADAIRGTHIASGQVGTIHVADNSIDNYHIRPAAVTSGKIASGQVGLMHLASGVIPAAFALTSGAVTSGHLGDVSVNENNVASGAISAQKIADNAILSGKISAGVIFTDLIASGTRTDDARRFVEPGNGGIFFASPDAFGSGTYAVAINASGRPCIAMPDVAQRMPAIGIASGGPVSGNAISILRNGFAETGLNTSGQVGKTFWVGQSGWIAFVPPADGIRQALGVVANESGRLLVTPVNAAVSGGITDGAVLSGSIASGQVSQNHLASGLIALITSGLGGGALTSGQVQSGHIGNAAVVSGSIASGQVHTNHISSGSLVSQSRRSILDSLFTEETISGFRAVSISQSGQLRVATTISGTLPAIGICEANYASGDRATVICFGEALYTSGLTDVSGRLGLSVWLCSGGAVSTASGSWASGGFGVTSFFQRLGVAVASGKILFWPDAPTNPAAAAPLL